MSEHVQRLKEIVLQAGAIFEGIQMPLFPDDETEGDWTVILFSAPLSGRLLSLKDDAFFTVNAVKEKMEAADAPYLDQEDREH